VVAADRVDVLLRMGIDLLATAMSDEATGTDQPATMTLKAASDRDDLQRTNKRRR